jgi:alcohol dehydrogenase class IV
MVMDISFRLDPEIVVGPDTIGRTGTICGAYGKRALIVTEQALNENQSLERLKGILADSQIETIVFDEIPSRPTAGEVKNAAGLCHGACCSMVIGFGGLDIQTIARLTALMSSSGIPVFDLLDGQKAGADFLPYVAIPTASGDPFLFSNYFIAIDPRDRSVKQIKTPDKFCAAAIIDSGLLAAPSSGFVVDAFDGFCAAVEAYCSTRANLLSDTLLERAILIYARIIKTDVNNADFDAAVASANAGYLLALGVSASAPGIGAALSYALNGRFPAAKSQCAAALLPYIMERLVAARPEKMAKITALMSETTDGASVSDSANLAVDSIRRRMRELKIPSQLRELNLSLDRLASAAEFARNLEFVSFSPWTVSAEDAFDILKRAF